MTIPALLAELAERNIELTWNGADLGYRAPSGALTDDDKATLRARKPELIAYLRARQSAQNRRILAETPAALRPSLTQEVWWRLVRPSPQQLEMEKLSVVLPLATAPTAKAEAAVRAFIGRHPVLLTRLGETGGRLEVRRNAIEALQVAHTPVTDMGALQTAMAEFADAPLPVDGDWLIRAAVFDVQDGPRVIMLVCHHIIFDGTSLGLASDGLKAALCGRTDDEPGIQFDRYAASERAWFESGKAAPLIGYWRDWIARVPTLRTPEGNDLTWMSGVRIDQPLDLPRGLAERVARTASRLKVTPFAVILAMFATALARWSGQTHFPLRAIGDLRASQALSRTVGLLICADVMEVQGIDGDFDGLARRLSVEYASAVSLRMPTHPAGSGAGLEEFHEKVGATINYVPRSALQGVGAQSGEAECDDARTIAWPNPANLLRVLDWPVHVPSIFLRLWETDEGLNGRLETNRAIFDDATRQSLAAAVTAASADLPDPG